MGFRVSAEHFAAVGSLGSLFAPVPAVLGTTTIADTLFVGNVARGGNGDSAGDGISIPSLGSPDAGVPSGVERSRPELVQTDGDHGPDRLV